MTLTAFSPNRTTYSIWTPPDFFEVNEPGTTTSASPSYASEPIKLPDFITLFDVNENSDALEPTSIASVTDSITSLSKFISSPTATFSLDYEMIHLLHAVRSRDETAFTYIADQMNWHVRSSDDLLLGIRFALHVGAHDKARELAQLGKEKYPEHVDLQKAWRILAPPKALTVDSSHAKKASLKAVANMKWIKENGDAYRGQWVALKEGSLIASAATSKEIFTQLEDPKDKSILVTMVY